MIIVTTGQIEGKKVAKTLGLVRGNTIRAKNIGKDILAGIKNLFGGEIKSYTSLMTESREEAVGRMVEKAEELGANAIIGFRFMTSSVMGSAAEILAYGTAVVVEDAS